MPPSGRRSTPSSRNVETKPNPGFLQRQNRFLNSEPRNHGPFAIFLRRGVCFRAVLDQFEQAALVKSTSFFGFPTPTRAFRGQIHLTPFVNTLSPQCVRSFHCATTASDRGLWGLRRQQKNIDFPLSIARTQRRQTVKPWSMPAPSSSASRHNQAFEPRKVRRARIPGKNLFLFANVAGDPGSSSAGTRLPQS